MIPFLFGVGLSCLLWSGVFLWLDKRRRKVPPVTLYRRRNRDKRKGEEMREENDSFVKALADCREAAFSESVENPYLAGAVGDPLEVPAYVTYAVEWLSGMHDHWKANHDNQVARARFLIERGDIPVERVRAYCLMGALLDLEEAIRHDREIFEGTSDEDNPMGMLVTHALNRLDAARGAQ